MKDNEIVNDIIEETINTTDMDDMAVGQPCSGKDLGLGILIGTAIAAGAYGVYKGIKILVRKAKEKKEKVFSQQEWILQLTYILWDNTYKKEKENYLKL